MGYYKRLMDARADGDLCVLCGKPDPEIAFMSGAAHRECEAVYAHDLAEWQRDQAEEMLAQAAAHLDDMHARGDQ